MPSSSALLLLLLASLAAPAAPQDRTPKPPAQPPVQPPAKAAPVAAPAQDPSATGKPKADPQVEAAAERARLEEEYFATCDYDSDGWISFREGEAALLLTRTSFAQYDLDRDGRVTREEFSKRFLELLDRTGAFRKPTPKGLKPAEPGAAAPGSPENPLDLAAILAGTSQPAPSSTPETFVRKYDKNIDGKLDANELVGASETLGFAGLSGSKLLSVLDKDGSRFVEPKELEGALDALGLLSASGAAPALPKPKSIDELFGGSEPRISYPGATPRPPFIQGPVRPFRRLDLDDNGQIEVSDLDTLAMSAHPRMRPAALIATLDLDGDGALSAAEFAAAFDG